VSPALVNLSRIAPHSFRPVIQPGLPNIAPAQLWLVAISPKASEFPLFAHRAFEEAVKLGEPDLADDFLDGLRQAAEALQLAAFVPNLFGVAGQGDRLRDMLPAFPIGLLHFLELVFGRDLGRRLASDVARS
jgi:hypothetical protein